MVVAARCQVNNMTSFTRRLQEKRRRREAARKRERKLLKKMGGLQLVNNRVTNPDWLDRKQAIRQDVAEAEIAAQDRAEQRRQSEEA